VEGAVADFPPVIVALLVLGLLFVLRLDRQHVIGDRDLHLLRADAGKGRLDLHLVIGLGDLYGDGGLVVRWARDEPPRPRETFLEKAVHGGAKLSKRIPTREVRHLSVPPLVLISPDAHTGLFQQNTTTLQQLSSTLIRIISSLMNVLLTDSGARC